MRTRCHERSSLTLRRNTNKLRIIALYIQYREGVPAEDLRRLFQHARLSQKEQDTISALALLGVRTTRVPGDRDVRKKIRQKVTSDEEYELSRYRPLIQTMLEVRMIALNDIQVTRSRNMSPADWTRLFSLICESLHPLHPRR